MISKKENIFGPRKSLFSAPVDGTHTVHGTKLKFHVINPALHVHCDVNSLLFICIACDKLYLYAKVLLKISLAKRKKYCKCSNFENFFEFLKMINCYI